MYEQIYLNEREVLAHRTLLEYSTYHNPQKQITRERSGSVVECLTRDQRAAGSSLTSVTALCP